MPGGQICNVSKLASAGFGFIKPDSGGDNIYFHVAR